MRIQRARFCSHAGLFHCLRGSIVLLARLIFVAALSSCGSSSAPADEISSSQADSSFCLQQDRVSLTALYNATGGPNWHDSSNWLSQKDTSTWFGVTTNEDGCVTRLDLESNNLTGTLPPDIGRMTDLRYLNLRRNNLTGQFPLEWENAANMTNLYLAGNDFRGCIPREFAHLRKNPLRGLFELITDTKTSSRTDVTMLSIFYCSSDDEALDATRPYNDALSAPSDLSYAVEGHSIIVSWDPVADAEYYIVYHDNTYDSRCELSSFGSAISCQELAAVHGSTSYTHVDAPGTWNDYWVSACNDKGCSALEPENSANVPVGVVYRPGVDVPLVPANLIYAHEGSAIVLSWDPIDGADSYSLYHHEHFSSSCHVQSDGSYLLCEQVAANLSGSSFVHTDPAGGSTYYWVAACNDAGCSPLEGESPARPVAEIPLVPSNLTWRLQDASTVVTWDPVDGADYYNLYHHAHASFCIALPDGTFSPYEQIAANLTEPVYLHAGYDEDRSHYWVAACNRGGCSPIDSR